MRVRPGTLPKIRAELEQIARDEAEMPAPGDPRLASAQDILAGYAPDLAPRFDDAMIDRSRRHARIWADRAQFAELWMVTSDMRDAALDAARDVPPVALAGAWPSRAGVIAYDGGLPTIEVPGIVTGRPSVLRWCADDTRAYLALEARQEDLDSVAVPMGPRDLGWITLCQVAVPHDELLVLDEIGDADAVRMISLALATWILAETPTVAEQRDTTQPGPKTGHGGRRDAPRKVKVVELRRLRRAPAEKGDDTDGTGRVYRHQWVVRGHWRQQPHGPRRSLRRTTWVPSYIKGPEGTPFLPSEQVFVWRR